MNWIRFFDEFPCAAVQFNVCVKKIEQDGICEYYTGYVDGGAIRINGTNYNGTSYRVPDNYEWLDEGVKIREFGSI